MTRPTSNHGSNGAVERDTRTQHAACERCRGIDRRCTQRTRATLEAQEERTGRLVSQIGRGVLHGFKVSRLCKKKNGKARARDGLRLVVGTYRVVERVVGVCDRLP